MHYQAIKTMYFFPTNTRPARVKAVCQTWSITLSYADGLGLDKNHEIVCHALMAKIGWTRPRVAGVFNGDYYWVEA